MISAKPEIGFHIILAALQCVHATTFFRKGLDGNGSALHPPKSPNKLSHASQMNAAKFCPRKSQQKRALTKKYIALLKMVRRDESHGIESVKKSP